MRDRQARQGVIPTPQPQPLKELPQVEGRPAPEQLQQAMDAAGLTPIERHVLQETYKERTYDEIAHDPELGRVYTRAGVQAIDKRARGRLKEATGIELPSAHAQGVNVTDRAIDAAERGQLVNFTDLHADPEAPRKIGARIDELERIDGQLDDLTKRLARERAAGTLTPEREAAYVAEFAQLHSAAQGVPPAEAGQPARGTPAPPRGQGEAGPPLPPPQGVHPEAAHEQGPAQAPEGRGSGEGTVPLAPGAGQPGEPARGPAGPTGIERARRGRGFVKEAVERARAEGIPEEWVHQAAREILREGQGNAGENAALVDDIKRVLLSHNRGMSRQGLDKVISRWRNQGGDWGKFRGMDLVDREVDGPHQQILRSMMEHRGDSVQQVVFDLLTEGKQHQGEEAAYQEAVDRLIAQAAHFERQAQEEQVQQAMTGRPRMIGGGQASGPGIVLHPQVQQALHKVGDFLDKLAGVTAPAVQRHSEASAVALAHHGAADIFAEHAAPYYTEMMMGRDAPEAKRLLWGAVFVEKFRLRYTKAQFQIEADRARRQAQGARTPEERQNLLDQAQEWEDKAAAVQTLVGPDPGAGHRRGGIELTEELYQETLNSPEFRAMLGRWHDRFVPVQEGFYRQAEGMDVDDPIVSRTQTPGYAINVIPLKAEEMANVPGAMLAQGGRGNLKNVKQQKLVFTREFTGTADAYDVDLGHMIENTLRTGARVATKAELYRQLVRDDLAVWGRENAYGTKVGGEETKRIPGVSPPRGTQEAQRGETALWVRKGVERDVMQVLGPHEPPPRIPGADALTAINLWSLAEAMSHTKNLLTMLFKPGVRVRDIAGDVAAAWRNDPWAAKRMMELARMGAARGRRMESTPEAGLLRRVAESPWNPTSWTGKFLDVVDRGMRLTMDRAFDRLVRKGAKDTESNRRDFINQLGNYNKRTQSRLVAFLRDTGLGPFATAATNYTMQGMRALVGNPGVKTDTPQAQLRLRAEYIGRMGALIAAGAVWNFLRWGRLDGDENTPLGAVKLGVGRDGRTAYFDLAGLTGITRGARTVGLLALLEGVRQGRSRGATIDRAGHDILRSSLHAAEGPAVQFAHTAATGENSLGMRIAERNGESQLLNNLRAALWNANPLVATLSASDQAQRVHPEPVPLGQRAVGLLSPLGLRFRGDQSLSVLGERLREVEAARQAFRNTPAWRSGRVFPREQEYQALSRAQQQVTTLNQELQGLVRTRRGLAPGAEANPQRQEQIRRQQAQVAQQALR